MRGHEESVSGAGHQESYRHKDSVSRHQMNLLVPNLGSTSLKYQILEMPSERVLARGRSERVRDYGEAIAQIGAGGVPVDAVAFKAVHAGPRYCGTFVIDDALLRALEEFLPAAPAHNAIYLAAIRAFRESLPGIPLVAAFETEFHSHHARLRVRSTAYPPIGARKASGSTDFTAPRTSTWPSAAPTMLGRQTRLVSCHLGGSSSMCAIDCGRSIDTSMGFSPQSGLENATRHGDLDAFAVLFMMERHGWTCAQVREQLAKGGGLAGLSGIEGGDVRDLEQAAAAGDRRAAEALQVFVYQVKKTIGAYAAAMGGLDAVAFTGGIGENSASLRAACCHGLEFLGIALDPESNEHGSGDRLVSNGRWRCGAGNQRRDDGSPPRVPIVDRRLRYTRIMIDAAVLTISDSVHAGTRADVSGPAVRQRLEQLGWSVSVAEVMPDDAARHRAAAGCAGRQPSRGGHLHHRRHGRGGARCYSGSHPRSLAQRDSRPRRIDARPRIAFYAHGGPFAGHRRHARQTC